MFRPNLESTGDSTLRGLVYEARPWQWYKQLILYVAVVFSGSAGAVDAWVVTTLGAILFSAIASATYLLNDVKDREADRQHPRKRHRPIASGQVAPGHAVVVALLLYVCAGALSWRLDPVFFGLVGLYVGQNVLYSYGMKSLLFVDMFSISAGFVVRAVAGVVLISAPLSPWFLLCAFLAALMLAVSKRWGEQQETEDPTAVRESLSRYTDQTLEFMLWSVATMLLMAYALYTFSVSNISMMLTIPFAFYAVFWFVHLTYVNGGHSEPASLLLERASLTNFALWSLTTLAVLYWEPVEGAI